MLGTLALLAAVYLVAARALPESGPVGPAYFPQLLAAALILLCAVKLTQILRRKNTGEAFSIPGLGRIVFALAVVALYFLSWELFGLFYPATFLALMALLVGFAPKERRRDRRAILVMLAISTGFTLFLYLFFERFMAVQF